MYTAYLELPEVLYWISHPWQTVKRPTTCPACDLTCNHWVSRPVLRQLSATGTFQVDGLQIVRNWQGLILINNTYVHLTSSLCSICSTAQCRVTWAEFKCPSFYWSSTGCEIATLTVVTKVRLGYVILYKRERFKVYPYKNDSIIIIMAYLAQQIILNVALTCSTVTPPSPTARTLIVLRWPIACVIEELLLY